MYSISLGETSAKTDFEGEDIGFYYTTECEGVIVGTSTPKDYKWMKDLPDKYTHVVNALIEAFHKHRENVLKLDKYMKPIKEEV